MKPRGAEHERQIICGRTGALAAVVLDAIGVEAATIEQLQAALLE